MEVEEDKWAGLRPLPLRTILQTFIWKEGKMYWPIKCVPHLRQLPLHQYNAVSVIDMVIFDSHANGWYVYIETSAPRVTNDTARLISQQIPAGQSYCLQFWYHMYGAHVNLLNVYVKTGGTLGQPVWSQLQSQGNQWNFGQVQVLPLPMAGNLVFEGVRGPSYMGKIGLDDIWATPGSCAASSGLTCTFESGLCGWTQDTSDDFDWTPHSGTTSTAGTGPTYDHTLGTSAGKYEYIETSAPRRPGQKARLISVAVSNYATPQCLSFFYNLNGIHIGALNVYMMTGASLSNTDTPIWTKTTNLGNQWVAGQTPLKASFAYKIVIEGVVGNGYLGDIAIDVTILSSTCTGSVNNDFEHGFGVWSNPVSGDDFDWIMGQSATSSQYMGPSSDHTLRNASGVSQDMKIDTCCHEPTAVTILRHGFWQATLGNPKIAFILQLLELAVHLQLHGCLSLQAFMSSIRLTFGQRCTEGAGLHDGEGMERIWSHLKKFAPSTKQMALANPQDLLTLMAYLHRIFKNLDFNSQGWLMAARQMEIWAQARNKGAVKLTWNEEYAYAVVQMAEKVSEFNTSTDLSSTETLVDEIRRLDVRSDKLQKRLRLETTLDAVHPSTKNEAVAAKIKITHLNLATALGLAKERQFLTHLLSKYEGFTMGNKGKKLAPEKNSYCYQENDMGNLADILGQHNFFPSPLKHLLNVYSVMEVRLRCRYPAMRMQMLRYLSFCMVDSRIIQALGVWPSRLAAEGYFFHRQHGYVCFFCAEPYRHHLPGCCRDRMNIRNGVQAPGRSNAAVPVPLQQLSGTDPRIGLRLRGVRGVEESNDAGDLSLDVLFQRSRPPSDDDHDLHPVPVPLQQLSGIDPTIGLRLRDGRVLDESNDAGDLSLDVDLHPAGRSNAAVPVPLQPAHNVPPIAVGVADEHPRSASPTRPREQQESRDVARTPSPVAETVPRERPVSDHPLRRATATTPVIDDSHPFCTICKERPASTIFWPCGHTVCSMVDCGSQQEHCPVCGQRVQSRNAINGRL